MRVSDHPDRALAFAALQLLHCAGQEGSRILLTFLSVIGAKLPWAELAKGQEGQELP
jgi:hypothetical protein